MMKLLISGIVFSMLTGTIMAQNTPVVNAGFEDGLASWTAQAGGSSSATYSSETADASEGTKSLKCEVVKAGTNYWDIQFMNNTVSLAEGVSYRASAWAKGSVAGMKMNFAVGKASAGYTAYGEITNVVLTTEWKEYSFTFTSPVTTTTDARVVFNVLSAGTYLFDNFKIVESTVNKAEVSKNGKTIDIELVDNVLDPSKELDLTFFVHSQINGYKKVDAMMWNPSKSNTIRITLSDTVFLKEEVTVTYYPGTIAKNTGDEIAEFSVVPVNGSTIKQPEVVITVKPENIGKIDLYPVPFNNFLNIQLSENKVGEIIIADITGRVVLKQSFNGQSIVGLNTSGLIQGLYIIKVVDGLGAIQTIEKAIKK